MLRISRMYCTFHFSGTGKSVLLRAMVRALNQDHGRSDQDSFVGVTASTATAAANLAVEPRAHTLHSWSGYVTVIPITASLLCSADIRTG